MPMTSVAMDRFEATTKPYRRELLAHCYRMTGSAHDADDLVQETYVRAWRAFDRFEGRSSVRTWLYRIATNVCLTALDRRARRPLPSGLGPPSPDPYARAEAAPGDVGWLEPYLDGLALDERADPAEVAVTRQTLRLALVAAAQVLPPRQRAAFFLCDVLARPAAEAAEVLDVSVGALKSLLQRARSRLDQETLAADEVAEPTDEGARRVLDRYMAAFERSDMAEIERLLVADAILEMTGTTTWFSGKATCVPYIAVQAIGHAGDWRMLPIHANGQLAAAAYHLGEGDTYHPFAIVVVATTSTHLTRISLFAEPALFALFDLPPTMRAGLTQGTVGPHRPHP
ncbi:MAG TPA: RNA polymerase subunit sigma-70 [Acidimicrobiales bacterium]|nr:RNA polymerase subunit sigma-70 [Acidimicrobiales bacterium]